MCEVDKFNEKLQELEDYMEFVNTVIDDALMWENELYVAYATSNDLTISSIGDWHTEAEDRWVSIWGLEEYLQHKYEIWKKEDIDAAYDKEVFIDGTLYECRNYWFTRE